MKTRAGWSIWRRMGVSRSWALNIVACAAVNGCGDPYYAPKLKKRTELFAKLREIFRQNVGQPGGKVIEMINPVLRGWVNYFRVGDSHRCFSMIKYWVEKKIRRHLMRARGRKGMGWKRWSREWIYGTLGLFNDYRVGRQLLSKAAPAPHVT
jgi:RNA-directed DNA polymerase